MKKEQELGEIQELDMTNEIVRMLVKSIIQILKDNNVEETVIKKIEDLLNK